MPTVKQVIANQSCSTTTVRGLSLQIIAEMNLLIPNVLVNFEDLNIHSNSQAVNLFLQPAAKEALRRAIQTRGTTLKINSAYRTVAQQHLLRSWYENGKCNIRLAAKPGLSNHEDGLALDTPDFQAWISALENEGWDWFGNADSVHFTYRGSSVRDDIGDIGVKAFQQLWNKNNPNDQITVDGRFGPQTAARLDMSPAEGFAMARLLKLTTPNLQGEDVRKVQQALVNAGFLSANQINGIYDNDTESTVEKFQEEKGLSQDGVVGPQTRRLLGIS
ncbi:MULTISPECIES: peptidoglycan-binding protein [Cyanophyceae]|uniref:peptidoglycan-binding protein n=1 Tax=Cyanophyceae TaxID=3028117 RepID=UPI00232CA085|nr:MULTISPECIES: peptidoglycan-binding protein [Cyanophyceae]MDB9356353.1 peptidoglycan-binding protein [Nodularia spumigena CS-587/03]MDB9316175.1 peptidoglycan-binding protein [Nodularia spumigena CS-590/01A]MDB9327838.1 peptidoglycan-binding protein [Nodularia spumigena CS-590/02]MDB9337143.1 peptidoglycan-binding protein [Nodularia spumigena CS-590/01]MDB9341590.1 peptidoglycan-binding protein [Nodularia spumigena CS-589/07]